MTPGDAESIKERNEALFREEFRAQKSVLACRPMYLQLETTSRCNFNCAICERTASGFKGADLVDDRLLERLERDVLPTLRDSSIQAFGEPLLDPRFDDILDLMEAHGVHTGFTTNGSLLTPARLERYARQGAFLCVSIDGASAEVYGRIRPHGRFDEIVEALSDVPRLKDAYPDSGFQLRIHFVGTTQNIDDLSAMVDLAERVGADDIEVINLQTSHLPAKVAAWGLASDPARANRRFREAADRAKGSPVELRLPPFFDSPEEPFDPSKARNYILWPKLENSRSPYPVSCSEPWNRLVVSANGDAHACCVWPYALGNLAEQEFDEVWNSAAYQKVRRRVNARYPQAACKDCSLWYGINGGRKEAVETRLPWDCRLHSMAQNAWRRLRGHENQ